MLPNNSAGDSKKSEANNQLFATFDKVTKFISWSNLEHQTLQNFQRMLYWQLKISSQQLENLLLTLKIDHELSRNLVRMADEIKSNLELFFENSQAYQYLTESKCLSKVNLLIKNSCEEVKTICQSLIFLHFASRNMGNYNKIIHFYSRKAMVNKTSKQSQAISFIFKHKIFSVISILYIQNNQVVVHHDIILAAICEREKYLVWKWKQPTSEFRQHKKRSKLSIYQGRSINAPMTQQIMKKQEQNRRNQLYYEVITMFLRYKLVDALVPHHQQLVKGPAQFKNSEITVQAEKHAWVLTLIHRFLLEIKQKNFEHEIREEVSFFKNKMTYYLQLCQKYNKTIDENLYNEYGQLDNEIHQRNRIFRKTKTKLTANEQSVHCKNRAMSQSNVNQKLSELFFKNNEKLFSCDKNRSKSAKAWMRDRSKSKIMAKILANTFENAKNALRQIQFQIKTNNVQELTMAPSLNEKKSKLVKKKKKIKMYEQLNKNRKIVENLCKNSLTEEIDSIEQMQVFNQFDLIEQNKKCIIDHKIIHKDNQQTEGLDLNIRFHSTEQIHSEVQSRLEFIKIIEGIPSIFNIRIKPKDKNYVLKIGFSPPNQQEINIQISLPKSNNIFTGRYQTIWPTIKYLLRKKLLQHPLLKEHESKIFESRPNVPVEQRNHDNIKQQNLLGMFGPIDEEEFAEISATLSLICKFVDIMLFSLAEPQGRRYSLCEFHYEKENNPLNELLQASSSSMHRNSNYFLAFIKQNIRMTNKNNIPIGASLIKQRVVELHHFNRSVQNPYYIYQISTSVENFERFLTKNELFFTIKILSAASERVKQKDNLRVKNCHNQKLYEQQIRVQAEEIRKYKIDLADYISSVRKLFQGAKFSQILQLKIMQVCWLYFSKRQIFHAPSFFNYEFKQIAEPRTHQVSSRLLLLHKSIPNFDFQSPKINTYENILEFKLEEFSFASKHSQSNNNRLTQQSFSQNYGGASQLHLKHENRVPSINTAVTKKCLKSPQLPCFQRISLRIKQNVLKRSLLKIDKSVSPLIAEVKFLTPFQLAYNWIAEIKVTNLSNNKIDKVVLSAHDLCKIGYENIQTSKQVLQSIQKLITSVKINHSTLVPKLVIQASSCERGNISIEASYLQFRGDNDDPEFDQNKSAKNTNNKLKFRSIVFDKRNYKHHQYQDKPYFKMSGSVIQSRPTGLLEASQRRTKKKLTMNFFEKERGEQFEKTRLKKSKTFLTKLIEYEEYLCTAPYKLIIKSLGQLQLTSLYALMSIKSIAPENECSQMQSRAFIQSEYTLVSQIREEQLRQICESLPHNIPASDFDIEHRKQQLKPQMRPTSTKHKDKNEKYECARKHIAKQQQENGQPELKRTSNKQNMAALKKQLCSIQIAQGRIISDMSESSHDLYGCTCCQGKPPSRYSMKIRSAILPMKIRLYHQYDPANKSVVDVYLHSESFEVKTGVNSGVGLGAEIEIAKIGEDDHLQLAHIRWCTKLSQTEQLQLNSSDSMGMNTESKTIKKSKKGEESMPQSWLVMEEVTSVKILELIRQYKLEHMQAHHYSKNTILLTQIAKYLVKAQLNCGKRNP